MYSFRVWILEIMNPCELILSRTDLIDGNNQSCFGWCLDLIWSAAAGESAAPGLCAVLAHF